VALSPDGRLLAAAGYKGELRLLDVERGQAVHNLQGRPDRITAVVFSPDGKTLFTGGVGVNKTFPNCPIIESDVIHTWDVATGREGPVLDGKAHRLVRSGAGQTFVASGARLRLDGPEARGPIRLGNTVLSIEYVTQVWNGETGTARRALTHHGLLAIPSPDGTLLVTAQGTATFLELGAGGGNHLLDNTHEKVVSCFDLRNGQLVIQLPLKTVSALAFSPDGKRLALGTRAGKVLIYDMEANKKRSLPPRTQEQLWGEVAGPPGPVRSRATWALCFGGNDTVRFLKEKLLVPKDLDVRTIRKCIAELDSDNFATRQAASALLLLIGRPAAYRLVKAARAATPSPEVARRLAEFLEEYEGADGSPRLPILRCLQAIEILEEINTPEARELVDQAGGDQGVFHLREACIAASIRMSAAARSREREKK
jgi:hypothetical protein